MVRLQDELNVLALFDRVYDYTQQHDIGDSHFHALREIRRREIMDEMKSLRTSKPEYRNRARISSAILLLCAGGYVTLHYLLR